MSEREKLIEFGRKKLIMSPLPVRWLKFLIYVYPIIVIIISVIGIVMNSVTISATLSEEVSRELSADKIAFIIGGNIFFTLVCIATAIYCIILRKRQPMLTEQTEKELRAFIIIRSTVSLITELATTVMRIQCFPERVNYESEFTFCGFTAITLAAFVVLNLKYLKKRSYVFLDQSYYSKDATKRKKKKKK